MKTKLQIKAFLGPKKLWARLKITLYIPSTLWKLEQSVEGVDIILLFYNGVNQYDVLHSYDHVYDF